LHADLHATGTGVPTLNRNVVHKQIVLVPPLAEQRTIVTVLDSVDDAIDQTRAVIEQTRRVKTALLTGLTTDGLPRRKTKFRTVHLGDVFQERKERGRAGLPVMAVTMNDGLVERASLDRRMETNLEPQDHLLARKGDIAYNMMRMWQGVLLRPALCGRGFLSVNVRSHRGWWRSEAGGTA